jgi:hypothetical protein
MVAYDTVYTFATNPGAGPTATAAAPGDSLNVRDFDTSQSNAFLEQIWRRGATAGYGRVRSPRLHDNVTGINAYSGETVDTLGFPIQASQPLYPNDALIVEESGGGAETDAVVLEIYYEQLGGVNARLAHWSDIQPNIRNLKAFQIAAPAGANAWTDTVITTTENQLHADADYALLGYRSSAACAAVGIKGPDTGNLRICGPGTTTTLDTTDWFIRQDMLSAGVPYIPVFAANNRGSLYASAIDVAAVAGLIVTFFCAELATKFAAAS